MILDGRNVPAGVTLDSEVVIVGSGPAGLTLAESLAANRTRVILVEAGDVDHDSRASGALKGTSIGHPFPLVASRRRAFSGTASHWTEGTGLRVRPFEEVDFESRPGFPDSGWPLTASEMAPFYAAARESVGLVAPAGADGPTGLTPLNWDGGPQAPRFEFAHHETYTSRLAAISASPNIELVLNASVARIELDGLPAAVCSLSLVTAGGNTFRVTGRTYILACGGIENARVLLASHGITGAGVGNEHDNVGRYFMDHLSVDSGIIEPAGDAPLDVSAFPEQHDQAGLKYQYMLRLGDDELRRRGLLGAAFWVNQLDAAYISPAVLATRAFFHWREARPLPPDVRQRVAAMGRGYRGLAGWVKRRALHQPIRTWLTGMRVMSEQLPNRDSRITLGDDRDALGIPRVVVDWRIHDFDRENIHLHQDRLAEHFEARGIGTIRERLGDEGPPPVFASNYHHMGATRMHADPARGVVDANGRVHSVANLYVAGSSVFPTGGYANPTLTIVALAIRQARTIAEQLRPVNVVA